MMAKRGRFLEKVQKYRCLLYVSRIKYGARDARSGWFFLSGECKESSPKLGLLGALALLGAPRQPSILHLLGGCRTSVLRCGKTAAPPAASRQLISVLHWLHFRSTFKLSDSRAGFAEAQTLLMGD